VSVLTLWNLFADCLLEVGGLVSEEERDFDMTQCQRPHGEEGFKVIEGMNKGHRPYIEWGIANIPDIDPELILDIGYGGGIVSRYILKKYPKAKGYGIDISEVSYQYAS